MISGKLFRQVLDKFLKSPVSQNARVQVVLPNGQFYDRESHRLVITIEPEKWSMGKVLKKL
jgi:hypothetical protein